MMDMNCSEVENQLSAYIDQELNETERQAVAKHVSLCQDCLGKLKAMQSASLMIKGLEELDVPAELSERLRQIANTAGSKELIAPNPAQPAKGKTGQDKGLTRGRFGLRLPSLPYLVGASAAAALALVLLLTQVISFNPDQQQVAKLEQSRQLEYGDATSKSSTAKDKAAQPKEPNNQNDELLLRGLPDGAGAAAQQSLPSEQESSKTGSVNAAGQDATPARQTFKIEKDLPMVVGSTKNYNAASADKLLESIKKKTNGVYTVADAKNQRSSIVNKLVQKVSAAGGDGKLVAGPINSLLDGTKRAALPVYIEKARFNNQDCLLIIISWGFGSADSQLDKASLYVTDLAGWNIMYYQKK